jgi:hypothetical protein
MDDHRCLLPWVITTLYCPRWSQLFVALDHHSFYCTGWPQLFIAPDDHSCYCLGRLQLFSTLDDQSCLLKIFLNFVNLQQLVHISTVPELTPAKISHLVQRQYIFLTGCWKEGWRAKIIPGPIKVSLQWRCLYAWMSCDHLGPQLTHETVTLYKAYATKHTNTLDQGPKHVACHFILCRPLIHVPITACGPAQSKHLFNLNCFLWWAVRLTKDFDIAG